MYPPPKKKKKSDLLLDQKSPFVSPRILKFLLSKNVLKCSEVKITVLCSFNREQEARIPFLRV